MENVKAILEVETGTPIAQQVRWTPFLRGKDPGVGWGSLALLELPEPSPKWEVRGIRPS